ncbi:hypothetical protein BHYA_0414g00040 [Botrytis hyacinthi]|uniref:Uncharacterized protein n=1 Tax=Botrytis hyacinthi TaxID=278943 RepID=A0A4Z1G9Q4_9HELO|nr:hypothetical protein BHYA_0414g00040 [Botrytis hyacinthi]
MPPRRIPIRQQPEESQDPNQQLHQEQEVETGNASHEDLFRESTSPKPNQLFDSTREQKIFAISQTPLRSPSPSLSEIPHPAPEPDDNTQDLLDQQLRATTGGTNVISLHTGETIAFTDIFDYFAANPELPKQVQAEKIDMAKVQTAQSGTFMDDFAAKVNAYDKKEELYKCLNMTKEDADAKHPQFAIMAGRGVRSTRELGLAAKRLERLVDPRSRAVAETVKYGERWRNNVTGSKNFARFLNSAPNGLDACCALNTAIIERLERIENGQHGGVRFPGATTADFKRAHELLLKSPVSRPSCKLSLLRKYGMHVLPSGLCDEWKAPEPHSSSSSRFQGEEKRHNGQYTLQVINDVPNHDRETRATAATPLRQAYETPIEILDSDDSDSEEAPATPSKKRRSTRQGAGNRVVIKEEPGSPRAKRTKRT